MPIYKLTYFNIRGRAELARLLFVSAGIKFEDIRIEKPEVWKELKPNMPQGQLPILDVDGVVFAQSMAIARFLAREFGLYGETNAEKTKIDEIVDTTTDFREEIAQDFREKDETKKAELEKRLEDQIIPKYSEILEKYLISSCGEFFVGSSFTLADLAVYDVYQRPIDLFPWILDKVPKLAAHRKRVEKLPRIEAYLKSRLKSVI
ncbi:hypothetical protein ScPMuIL_007782 [Solemya velum]